MRSKFFIKWLSECCSQHSLAQMDYQRSSKGLPDWVDKLLAVFFHSKYEFTKHNLYVRMISILMSNAAKYLEWRKYLFAIYTLTHLRE